MAPGKDHDAPSVLQPEHLLREARRQKGSPERDVPSVCVLDPDGDLVRYLRATGRGRPSVGLACYHIDLAEFTLPGGTIASVVGCAVGAAFAVPVAGQLFASGCWFLISITSAGRIAKLKVPSYVVLIDRVLRDEGTSWHYVPAGEGPFMPAPDPALIDRTASALRHAFPQPGSVALYRGATRTTDPPYRETAAAIAHARDHGMLAMEAAALYALSSARRFPIVCLAHVSNTMGQQNQAIGRSRGGPTTKIHALCDGTGRLYALMLTAGQVHDIQGGRALLASVPAMRQLIADRAYDANDLRDFLAGQGTEPVISPMPRRLERPAFDKGAYRTRNLIERAFCRLKDWRAIATRYDKTARNFLAGTCLAVAITDWLH